MAQRQARGGQATLQVWTEQARLHADGQRLRIQVQNPIEASQIERDGGPVHAADGVDPANDAGAAAERDHGHPGLRARLEHGRHLRAVGGAHDGVWSLIEPTRAQAHQVGVAAPCAVPHPCCVVVGHVFGPHYRVQRGPRGRVQRGLGQSHGLGATARLGRSHGFDAKQRSHHLLGPRR